MKIYFTISVNDVSNQKLNILGSTFIKQATFFAEISSFLMSFSLGVMFAFRDDFRNRIFKIKIILSIFIHRTDHSRKTALAMMSQCQQCSIIIISLMEKDLRLKRLV